MTDTLPRRLERLMKERGFNQKSLAEAARLNETAVRDILKGRSRRPLHTTIIALARTLACEPEELVGGWRGTSSLGPPGSATSSGSTATIRELDVRPAAGGNSSVVEILEGAEEEATRALYGFPASGFRELYGAPPEEVRILEVVGDSMAPELWPGQKVMVHLRDRQPSPPGVFVLWDGLGLVIKRVEFIAPSDPPKLRISSDNRQYAAYERTIDEVHILGRVIGRWARL
ncbi:MAG: helix-turn-helix domain-containing protein [Alphaproteobacteria bacterium]|nr:helix-turn-helix domain-containing protein [Alphaproteobacteria bacterium]